MPSLVVIGGPNGSGKTTLTSYLIQKGTIKSDVINPDEIAYKEFGDYGFHVKAARIALERRKQAVEKKVDFAFETTFSGNSEVNEIIAAKSAGYKTILYYVALESMLDNLTRVEERTTNLGHHVEREDIIRRHDKSRINLLKHITLFDKAYLFDNSDTERSRVAIFEKGILRWLNEKLLNHPFYNELLRK
ncbi:zeta toxin family protein [Mucilaginibacter ginsenosidivorans]|uniref:ATP-binding cassette domain-containing protein n=1 Tax=Mucilaginibacter ginsenosidivorans TaxID=398053 RepID=A0A5B8USK0_9SPHI|nr:zeta toxin family protein [Mucilaginibacter ginsenosidivorans]QEC61361.1 ATP-binding cassette domain-containing protein [Mucilaginibacter ginsenosidivorans]